MDGYVTIGTKLDTKSFDAQIDYISSQLDEIESKLKQADMGFDVGDTQKLEAKYETLSTKLTTLTQKKKDFDKADLSNTKYSQYPSCYFTCYFAYSFTHFRYLQQH